MKEYSELDPMESISTSERIFSIVWYLNHHAINRESSRTKTIRVVCDALAKSTSGMSLNDFLMVGPRIQHEHFPILLRFIILPVVTRADIEKIFRQVSINLEDRDFIGFLWRDFLGSYRGISSNNSNL